jgi:hypothetical protein
VPGPPQAKVVVAIFLNTLASDCSSTPAMPPFQDCWRASVPPRWMRSSLAMDIPTIALTSTPCCGHGGYLKSVRNLCRSPGSIDPVLALDAPQMLRGSYAPHVFEPGAVLTIGPFAVESRAVPHFVPAVAFRITVEGISMVYTGDCGPCSDVVHLADQADLLVAEATFIEQVPLDSVGMLCSSGDAGQQASEGQVRRLVLTHLWPGLDPARARDQARQFYGGPTDVARPGLTIPLAPH